MIDIIERQARLARYMAMPQQRLRSLLLRINSGGACSRDDLTELDDILQATPGYDTLRHAVRFMLDLDRIDEDHEQAMLDLIARYFHRKL